jgi:hypothetical protein
METAKVASAMSAETGETVTERQVEKWLDASRKRRKSEKGA